MSLGSFSQPEHVSSLSLSSAHVNTFDSAYTEMLSSNYTARHTTRASLEFVAIHLHLGCEQLTDTQVTYVDD